MENGSEFSTVTFVRTIDTDKKEIGRVVKKNEKEETWTKHFMKPIFDEQFF